MSTDIAEKIRRLIIDRDITDSALARAVGVSPSAIHRWTMPADQVKNDSVRRPSAIQVLRIARYFGVTMEYLVDDEMSEPESDITPDERAVISHYHVQRREEGEGFTPDELGWRIRVPRTTHGEPFTG